MASERTSILILLFAFGLFGPGPRLVWARLGSGAIQLKENKFDEYIKANDKVLVDFYDPQDSEWREGQSELDKAVRVLKENGCTVPVAKVDAGKEKGLADRFVKNSRLPQLMWFLHGEPTQYHRTLRKSNTIVDFVLALDREPVIVVKDEEGATNYNPVVFAKIRRSSPAFKLLNVVASKHMDQVAFAFLESDKDNITWVSNEKSLPYKGELTVDAMDRWVRTQLVKSEPVPEDPALLEDEGSQVIFGKTFEEKVLRPDKDVFLLVHAPWCGFCKKLMPTWDAMAQEFAEIPHLVVAKMDGSRNGSPFPDTFSWEAYPKLFYVKAGSKTPAIFEGNRTIENLKEFASKHSSRPLTFDLSGRSAATESLTDL